MKQFLKSLLLLIVVFLLVLHNNYCAELTTIATPVSTEILKLPLKHLCGGNAGNTCSSTQFCDFTIAQECGINNNEGVCTNLPNLCLEINSPVCGCDNQTYFNSCAANGAGVSVAYQGACAPANSCGGNVGFKCGALEFCEFTVAENCGIGNKVGVCSSRPEFCSELYQPVCGCNGETYTNACFANMSGVSVASKGACLSTTTTTTNCGGSLGMTCKGHEFCYFTIAENCGAGGAQGTCSIYGVLFCINTVAPVCGCDGFTYQNSCFATNSGVSVAYDGSCAPANSCGGVAGFTCNSGEFCDFTVAESCGKGSQLGTCTIIPKICYELYLPVCGCNGQTYGNACFAASAGVSVASQGACNSVVIGNIPLEPAELTTSVESSIENVDSIVSVVTPIVTPNTGNLRFLNATKRMTQN